MFPVSKVHYGHLIHGPNRVSATIVSRFSAQVPFGALRPRFCAGSSGRVRAQTSARPPPAWPPSRTGCPAGQVLPAVPPACTRVAPQGLPVQGVGVRTAAAAPFDPAPRRHGGCCGLAVPETARAFPGPAQARPSGPSPGPTAPARAGPPRSRGRRQHPGPTGPGNAGTGSPPGREEDFASVRAGEDRVGGQTRSPCRRCRTPRHRVRPPAGRLPPSRAQHPAMMRCTGWPAGSLPVPVAAQAASPGPGHRRLRPRAFWPRLSIGRGAVPARLPGQLGS